MKILDVALNAAIILSATLFLAYIGLYYFDFGLFVTLPESVTTFFTDVPSLQYVALAIAVAAFIAKAPVGRALKRREAERLV